MTLKKAIEVLEIHNKWRRGGEYVEMATPKQLGIAIDTVLKKLKKDIKK